MVRVRVAVCALIAVAGFCVLPLTAAHADDAYNNTPNSTVPINNGFSGGSIAPSVEGANGVRVQPAAVQGTSGSNATLPFTGGDVAGLSVIGVLLVGFGIVLVRRTRVRSA